MAKPFARLPVSQFISHQIEKRLNNLQNCEHFQPELDNVSFDKKIEIENGTDTNTDCEDSHCDEINDDLQRRLKMVNGAKLRDDVSRQLFLRAKKSTHAVLFK